jgi:hypothetical protein
MKDKYIKIKNYLDSLDFNELYTGFKQYDFALYNDKEIQFEEKIIPYEQSFKGNTAIIYESRPLAIWDMVYDIEDIEVFSSKLVHEMFHCYQIENNEKRWANEFVGMNYSLDKENINLKINEVYLLIEAYKNSSMESLLKFINIRKLRMNNFPDEVDYDTKIETIEGMAAFVEVKSLKQINNEKYEADLDNTIGYLRKIENILEIRKYSYHVGVLIQLVLDKLGLNISHEIKKEEKTIFQLLLDLVENNYKIVEIVDNNLEFLSKFIKSRRDELETLKKENIKIYYPERIIGFDPMNAFRVDNYLIFKHFVMFMENGNEITIRGESFIEYDIENKIKYLAKIMK